MEAHLPEDLNPGYFFMERRCNHMKIYVGNLSYSTTDEDVKAAFSQYGTVESADVITDRNTGRSKGFGFVEMDDTNEANAAIEGLNGKDIDGRNVNVNKARPREERPQRSNSRRY